MVLTKPRSSGVLIQDFCYCYHYYHYHHHYYHYCYDYEFEENKVCMQSCLSEKKSS